MGQGMEIPTKKNNSNKSSDNNHSNYSKNVFMCLMLYSLPYAYTHTPFSFDYMKQTELFTHFTHEIRRLKNLVPGHTTDKQVEK